METFHCPIENIVRRKTALLWENRFNLRSKSKNTPMLSSTRVWLSTEESEKGLTLLWRAWKLCARLQYIRMKCRRSPTAEIIPSFDTHVRHNLSRHDAAQSYNYCCCRARLQVPMRTAVIKHDKRTFPPPNQNTI